MRVLQLVEHMGADMAARFYVDGKRVSREYAQDLKHRADRMDCLHSTGRALPGGRIRRTNYATICIAK